MCAEESTRLSPLWAPGARLRFRAATVAEPGFRADTGRLQSGKTHWQPRIWAVTLREEDKDVVNFQILGPLRVLDTADHERSLGGSKPAAILALLILHANEV